MRKTINELVKIFSETIPVQGPIYEFGAFQVPGQEHIANLRPYFPDQEYIGSDMREGKGVDVILNLHDLDLEDESIGTAICVDTLEHVEYPVKAMEEIHRVLKPNGSVIISSVMNFPIHDYPYDYWRFTPEAFKTVLKPFQNSFAGFAGQEDFPHTVMGVGFKGAANGLDAFKAKYQEWQAKQAIVYKDTFLKKAVRQLTPPIIHPALGFVYSSAKKIIRQ